MTPDFVRRVDKIFRNAAERAASFGWILPSEVDDARQSAWEWFLKYPPSECTEKSPNRLFWLIAYRATWAMTKRDVESTRGFNGKRRIDTVSENAAFPILESDDVPGFENVGRAFTLDVSGDEYSRRGARTRFGFVATPNAWRDSFDVVCDCIDFARVGNAFRESGAAGRWKRDGRNPAGRRALAHNRKKIFLDFARHFVERGSSPHTAG